MAEKAQLYLVMKLHTKIEEIDSGKMVKLRGCAGYIPAYKTLPEALKAAGGKYEIQVITVTVT